MGITPYERTKKWRKENKERHASQQRRYYLNHKDVIRDYQREYARKRRANAQIQGITDSEVTQAA